MAELNASASLACSLRSEFDSSVCATEAAVKASEQLKQILGCMTGMI